MRQYSELEQSIQESFETYMPLSTAQSGRVVQMCVALLETNDLTLSKLARVLPHHTQQASRIRWIQRLLCAPFVSQSHLYHPLLRHALSAFKAPIWHLVIDRTTCPLNTPHDLAVISLNYQHRSIPLVWTTVQKGGAPKKVYCELIKQVHDLIPRSQSVIFHGDSEFGHAAIMRLVRQYDWHFILGLCPQYHLWYPRTGQSRAIGDLEVPARKTRHIPHVACFKSHQIPVNALAFRQTHHSGGKKRREIAYIVTSLPLNHTTKRLGRRRWGIEPLFKDYKSAGWNIQTS